MKISKAILNFHFSMLICHLAASSNGRSISVSPIADTSVDKERLACEDSGLLKPRSLR
jgi:hypothetical protein